MKKIISIAFVLTMLLNATGNAVLAESGSLNWFEAMDNMQKLKSYSMAQVISGSLEARVDEGKTASGNFSFNVKSDVMKRGSYKMDSKNTVDGKLHIALQGQDRPFNDMDVNFKLSVISVTNLGVYVRLENVDFDVNGILNENLQSYLDFRTEFDKAFNPIKWQWIHIPNQYLKGQLDQKVTTDFGGLDSKALKKDLVKYGFKQTIQKTFKAQIAAMVKSGEMEKEEATKARALIDRFFKTEFFNLKSVSRAGKEDSTTFKLNNGKIVNFVQEAAATLGETIEDDDLSDLRETIRKIALSGSFGQNAEFGIFDRMKVNLALKNISDLAQLQVGYSWKIGNINEVEAIKLPAKSIELDEANLNFLPSATDTTFSGLDTETSTTDWEPLPSDEF